jgi:YtkA-like
MIRRLTSILALISLLTFAIACGPRGDGSTREIKSAPVGNLTVTLANSDGVLRHGAQEFTLTFKDAAGKPVAIGAAALTFHMPGMGTMAAMNNAATLTTTPTPGVYHGKANIEMAGEWQAQVAYEGPAGRGQGSFPVTAQ